MGLQWDAVQRCCVVGVHTVRLSRFPATRLTRLLTELLTAAADTERAGWDEGMEEASATVLRWWLSRAGWTAYCRFSEDELRID